MPAFVSNEVPPLAIGLARRAIDDITELAAHTARFPGGPTVSERAVFHRSSAGPRSGSGPPGRCTGRRWRPPGRARWPARPGEEQQLAVTTASVFAVETCADVVSDLFRFGGGRALALPTRCSATSATSSPPASTSPSRRRQYEAAGRYLLQSAKARRT